MTKHSMKKYCIGCTACSSLCPKQCINMQNDADGFMHPFVDLDQCIDCHMCENVCPLLSDSCKKMNMKAYAVLSKDKSSRYSSSSGGFFSEMCRQVLNMKGIVYGAAYDNNFDVVHVPIESIEELHKLRGAKYSQSNLGNTFVEIRDNLERNRFILFSGTPCQVAGLKNFLKKEYDHLICVDFICHGIPSPLVWKEYVKYRAEIDNEGTLPISINMRSKETGWSRYNYCHEFQYTNKKVIIPNKDSLYMKLFVGDYINCKACSNCQFKGYSRISDFTLGDFWGMWDIYPEMDDNYGTSAVLIQSHKGERLFEEIKNNLIYKEVTLEQVSQQNPSILYSSPSHPKRDEALELIKNGHIKECEKFFEVKKETFLAKIKSRIKKYLS